MFRDTSILQRYMEIKSEMSALETELEELKGEITATLLDEPEERFEMPLGTQTVRFRLVRRTTWQYSEDLEGMAKQISKLKKAEELDGTATPKKLSIYPTHEWMD